MNNEIFEKLIKIINDKYALRGVIYFHGNNEGQSMLIDFSACGTPFMGDTACVLTLHKQIYKNGVYCGTEELSEMSYSNYMYAFKFVAAVIEDYECELKVESF